MEPDAPTPSMISCMEGFYLVHVIDAFRQVGLLEALSPKATVQELSRRFGYAPDILSGLLDFVASRTSLVHRSSGGYEMDPDHPDTRFALHILDQYAGAYGPCLTALPEILTGQSRGDDLIDPSRHAAAFAGADRVQVDPDVLRLLDQMQITQLLDIGCSTAGMLIEHALRHPHACCIGLDASPAATSTAAERIAAAGLEQRVRVLTGDLRDVGILLDRHQRDQVQCIVASNVLNAFFGATGGAAIDAALSALRAAFPQRFMVISDYFGTLGQPAHSRSGGQRGLVHDVAQLLSGQGVPPGDVDSWAAILARNGCTLVKAFEGDGGDVRRFILLVQMQDQSR